LTGLVETRFAIAVLRTLARLGRWADRRIVELWLNVDVAPDDEWPDGDMLFVLHAHNEGAKPLTIEEMGVLSLDRLHQGDDLSPYQRVREASWTKRLPQPMLLEPGRGRAEIRFTVEDLAYQGLSLRSDMLAFIAMSSDGRIWYDRVRDHFLWAGTSLNELLDAAERRGQAREGAKPLPSSMMIFSLSGRAEAEDQMRRVVREANRQRRGVRAR
jgi:hypothetical protein